MLFRYLLKGITKPTVSNSVFRDIQLFYRLFYIPEQKIILGQSIQTYPAAVTSDQVPATWQPG